VCQLILLPIVLKPFSFQKEWEGGSRGYRGHRGCTGYTGRDPGEIGGQKDTIGRREKSRKWPSSKRRGSGRKRGKLLNDAKYWAVEKRLKGGSKEKRGRSQKCKVWEKKEKRSITTR